MGMVAAKVLTLVILVVFLILNHNAKCNSLPVQPPSYCATQFAVVNRACAMLPFVPLHPDADSRDNGSRHEHEQSHGHDHEHEHGHNHGHGHEHEHGHNHGHGHEHSHEHEHRHKNRHGHRHRHRHWHHGPSSPGHECCRWLDEVENECVCAVLARLPPFLSRPVHHYTVEVEGVCDVSFDCGNL
ncbi:uncharacterized protein LOC127787111 [Diospyros lotus]|uniref:uncharacterized protein LOC127787111 n=1 Tax=Diospyros lotus TaxID=55363 RepID=UPI00224CEA09|nr:uncharacterized protein LOC127787111 [Diospyros lotus]